MLNGTDKFKTVSLKWLMDKFGQVQLMIILFLGKNLSLAEKTLTVRKTRLLLTFLDTLTLRVKPNLAHFQLKHIFTC